MSDLVVITVKVPKSMLEQIDLLCKVRGKTRSDVIREALRRYVMNELYGVKQ